MGVSTAGGPKSGLEIIGTSGVVEDTLTEGAIFVEGFWKKNERKGSAHGEEKARTVNDIPAIYWREIRSILPVVG